MRRSGTPVACAAAVLLLAAAAAAASASAAPLPVVMWHGMGDSAEGLEPIAALLRKRLGDGAFVHAVATGSGEAADVWSSFYGNVNQQVAKVCEQLAGMPELRGGFNMVGFSQGGQFLRAVVERCGHKLPKIHALVTLGGQHQGVSNTPGCRPDLGGAAAKACSVMQVLLGRGAYAPWVRENLVQAQYFKDPNDLDGYLASNIFLPDVNNEHDGHKRTQYADNLAALERLVLFRFDDDTTVVPRDSAWFSFWDGARVVPLREQPIYKQDWLGLKRLDEAGKLVLASAPGEHMQFTLRWFERAVVEPYLLPADEPSSGDDAHDDDAARVAVS